VVTRRSAPVFPGLDLPAGVMRLTCISLLGDFLAGITQCGEAPLPERSEDGLVTIVPNLEETYFILFF
jgi:hypothetical protein